MARVSKAEINILVTLNIQAIVVAGR